MLMILLIDNRTRPGQSVRREVPGSNAVRSMNCLSRRKLPAVLVQSCEWTWTGMIKVGSTDFTKGSTGINGEVDPR
jgi:hypothetical protein